MVNLERILFRPPNEYSVLINCHVAYINKKTVSKSPSDPFLVENIRSVKIAWLMT